MSFYNFTPEETRAICEFTERRTSRKTMTFMGGQSGPVHTQREEGGESATPYLDHVAGVVESVLRRYALTRLATEVDAHTHQSKPLKQQQQQHQEEASSSSPLPSEDAEDNSEATTALANVGERPYPFPSLFLHTPHDLAAMQDAVHRSQRGPAATASPTANAETGATLSRQHCTPEMPPAALLCSRMPATVDGAAAPTHSGSTQTDAAERPLMVPAPLPYEPVDRFPLQLRRNTAPVCMNASLTRARRMANVSLTPTNSSDAPLQQMVQVVLQAEIGLVVAATPPESSALVEAPFLLSPDATSCVLVACRVTLHPALHDAVAAIEAKGNLHTLFTDSCSAAARLGLLRAALQTATACLVHLDRPESVEDVLREMVWDSAVPAFAHAMHHHCDRHVATDISGAASPVAAMRLLNEAAQAVWRAFTSVSATTASPPSSSPGDSSHAGRAKADGASLPPVLHVDWYVVGGIRMKKCAGPVLEAVFRAFFPRARDSQADLLREKVELHTLLRPRPLPPHTESVPPEEAKLTLRVAHRLREDGQCFWSFNTTFQPWCVDPNAKRRYAYPVTWGLLLSVATGHCWPATVQPGTRMVPLSEVRHAATQFGYRWISPLESDARGARHGGHVADDGLAVVCDTVPSPTVAQRVNKLASTVAPALRLWSEFQALPPPYPTDAAPTAAHTSSLTLASYVRTMLDRQRAWWERRGSAASTSASSAPLRRVLPLFLSVHQRRRRVAANAVDGASDEKGEAIRWARLPMEVVAGVLAQPKENFLNSSTTPHCEPPDFCEQMRNVLLWRTSVGSEDVFVEGTDGLYID